MNLLVDFPSIVKKYAVYFEACFSKEGLVHFKKAISGFIVSENKTLSAINRLMVNHQVNQSSFNRFFNNQHFDLEKINTSRLAMLQDQEATRFKMATHQSGACLAIDNTLLTHWGECFDHICNLRDYVNGGYKWSHDLVTLYYSDHQTDYPVYYQLWEPPNWEAVAEYLRQKDFPIREDKWQNRHTEVQKWKNYIRSRYRLGRKKHPGVVQLYQTKIHIAERLLRKFVAKYPELDYPVTLDSGFTSSELCQIIDEDIQRTYVGALREDQKLILAGSKKLNLKDFTTQLVAEHVAQDAKPVFRKVGYRLNGQLNHLYAYTANHRINQFKKKQRLVIAFAKPDLTGTPYYAITNQLNWGPSNILRLHRQRWDVETYHQESKAEGLDQYQVRNSQAIQSYLALVVVTYSMLKCTIHDDELLSTIRQRLQKETKFTLPFLRRLMQSEALMVLVEFIFLKVQKGHSLDQILQPLVEATTY
jgi:hypothetical protein